MKISRKQLQTYFDAPLPSTDVLVEALTFHVFEIDSVETVEGDEVLDVKITANRVHDCNSYEGIAKELSAILRLPFNENQSHNVIPISVSMEKIIKVLGMVVSQEDIADVFTRLGFLFENNAGIFTVTVPVERIDLIIPEDLIEEVARIIGYGKIPSIPLPPSTRYVEINEKFAEHESTRDFLVVNGFSEVYTSVFSENGERVVLNKVDGVRPYLRANLTDGIVIALEKNIRNKEILGLKQVKIFEIGTVWAGGKEEVIIELAVEKVKGQKTTEEWKFELSERLGEISRKKVWCGSTESRMTRYKPFSKYPYIVRDIAVWVPDESDALEILESICREAGELVVRSDLIDDTYKKEARTSLLYRLIFQSFDHTLVDQEVQDSMDKISVLLHSRGFEIR